jgi:drug/metabolite transporter (DMT)-like permease
MFWALLSGIGACADAGYYIVNKKFLRSVDPDLLAASGFLFTSLFLLAISFSRGIPPLGPDFVMAVTAAVAINILGTTLAFRALKSTDISLAVPMLSFTPLFLIVTAAVMLHEIPSAVGICGILVLVFGSYVLNTTAEHESLLDPFHSMLSHPGIFSMLVVSFLYAIAIGFDKMIVLNSDTVFGSGVVFFLLGGAFAVIHCLKRRRGRLPGPGIENTLPEPEGMRIFSGSRGLLTAGIIIGILLTIEAMVINAAYLVQIVPYVSAIKRTSIIITVLYGTMVIREEEVFRRVAGAVLMVCGVVLILFFP